MDILTPIKYIFNNRKNDFEITNTHILPTDKICVALSKLEAKPRQGLLIGYFLTYENLSTFRYEKLPLMIDAYNNGSKFRPIVSTFNVKNANLNKLNSILSKESDFYPYLKNNFIIDVEEYFLSEKYNNTIIIYIPGNVHSDIITSEPCSLSLYDLSETEISYKKCDPSPFEEIYNVIENDKFSIDNNYFDLWCD